MILFPGTGQRYIGATTDLRGRRLSHLSTLKAGKNLSRLLQDAYDANGEPEWHVLEEIPFDADTEEKLRSAEIRHLRKARSEAPLLNDPNHAYRVKGNVGRTLDAALKEFRGFCEANGLRYRDELEVAVRARMEAYRDSDRKPGPKTPPAKPRRKK